MKRFLLSLFLLFFLFSPSLFSQPRDWGNSGSIRLRWSDATSEFIDSLSQRIRDTTNVVVSDSVNNLVWDSVQGYINLANKGLFDAGIDQDSLLNVYFSAATNGSNNRFYIPSQGTITVDDTLVISSDVMILGEGHRGATTFQRSSSYNGPVFKINTRRVSIKNIYITEQDSSLQPDNASPLIEATSYLSHWEDVWIYGAKTDGLVIGYADGSLGGSANNFYNLNVSHCGRWGVTVVGGNNNFFGGAIEYNIRIPNLGGGGILVDMDYEDWVSDTSTASLTYPHGPQIFGTRIEGNGVRGVFVNKSIGTSLDKLYLTSSSIYIADKAIGTSVTNATFVNGTIQDGGTASIIHGNNGFHSPLDQPSSYYHKGNLVKNPEFTKNSNWTASNATISYSTSNVTEQGNSRRGKGSLLVTTTADSGYVYQNVDVVAGENYVVHAWFSPRDTSDSRTDSVQIEIANPISGVVYAESEWRTGPVFTTLPDFVIEQSDYTTWRNSVNISSVQVRIKVKGNAKRAILSRVEMVRDEIVENGSFEGTYAAGVASSWSVGAGTATAVEDTVVFHSGSSAQKINGASGQNMSLRQTISGIDPNSLYLLKASIYIHTGTPNALKVGFGNTHTANDYSVNGVVAGRWHTVSRIVHPGNSTVLSIGFSTLGDTLSVSVDDVALIRLSDQERLASNDVFSEAVDILRLTDFGADGSDATIQQAALWANSTKKRLIIDDSVNISAPVTFDTLSFVSFEGHGYIDADAASDTLYFLGRLNADPKRIFSSDITVQFSKGTGNANQIRGQGLNDVFYAEWWGAKATAEADSTTAIATANTTALQKAINVSISRGATLQLLDGYYWVNATLVINSFMNLRGNGWQKSIIKLMPNTNDHLIRSGVFGAGWDVENLTLHGNGDNQTRGSVFVCAQSTGGPITIRNVAIKDGADYGFWGLSQNLTITECQIDDNGIGGIWIIGGNVYNISNNHIQAQDSGAVFHLKFSNVANGDTLYWTFDSTVSSVNNASGKFIGAATIFNNHFETGDGTRANGEPVGDSIRYVVWLDSSDGNTFIGNEFSMGDALENVSAAVYVDSGSALNTFIGNNVQQAPASQWRIMGTDNTFIGNKTRGTTPSTSDTTASIYINPNRGNIWWDTERYTTGKSDESGFYGAGRFNFFGTDTLTVANTTVKRISGNSYIDATVNDLNLRAQSGTLRMESSTGRYFLGSGNFFQVISDTLCWIKSTPADTTRIAPPRP